MAKTIIEWTETSWNPVTGCTKTSPGCLNCYAEKMSHRLKAMGNANYKNEFKVTIHKNMLQMPLKLKKPQLIFVNSMSDLFHRDVPVEFIRKIFNVMTSASWHTFQILTKREERLLNFNHSIYWPKNVWMGVSVENKDYLHRIDYLRNTDAFLKFISFEPLIGPINEVDLAGIDWVIVGGESGPGARTINKEWVINLRDICINNNIPFFFKQWGGVNKKKTGSLLDGCTWKQYPDTEKALYRWEKKLNEKIVPLYNKYNSPQEQLIMKFG